MVSEFIALDKCGEWLCHFLEDILEWPKLMPPICIHYDSQSAIGKAHKAICIMVSLDIFVIDIIPLDNYSQQGLSL